MIGQGSPTLVKITNIGQPTGLVVEQPMGLDSGKIMYWLKQSVYDQPIIPVVKQPMELVSGSQCIG